MPLRRSISHLLNAPLRCFGLTLTRLDHLTDHEARIADLADQLARAARQTSEQESRWQDATRRLNAAEGHRRRLAAAARLPLPVYLTDDFRPASQLAQGASPHRIVVCSIPKAGTYLVGRLLELLGCVPTQLHLSSSRVTDYRFATMREARENFQRLLADVPLDRAVELILPGQFSVGHLECDDYVRGVLSSVKKLFVFRDLRDAIVSYLRFLASTGRDGESTRAWKDMPAGPEQMSRVLDAAGRDYFNMALPMIDWLDQPEVFFVSFETLYGDSGREKQQQLTEDLYRFLELPGEAPDFETLRGSLFGAPTMTWSGGRVSRETYWNDDVQRRFAALGGVEANRRLGYEDGDAGQVLPLTRAASARGLAA